MASNAAITPHGSAGILAAPELRRLEQAILRQDAALQRRVARTRARCTSARWTRGRVSACTRGTGSDGTAHALARR